ncbi:hypothetical protein C7H85_14405 [Zobellella endophytica]|uniref:Uncharacterized protein n=1 Tax=Zobellella endophytica TaxID=2116700 RepID=A0A2P7R2S8_9GAMM|nr:STY4851/ECs_5259 family protein [Zobellella endophytica]PSJ44504.1 hypothetical protein C7H85_14405 [Zobellella endophytica]
MTATSIYSMSAKAWISEFLFSRVLFKGPNGKPLYSYHVTEHEYRSLTQLLSTSFKKSYHSSSPVHLAACFCLFVSEHYRRHYNSSWSWSGAEEVLETELSPQSRASLTSIGLHYWQRPVRARENGNDWLGSLFIEGGLPWPLVQNTSHGFGKAVRRGIKHFYRTEGNRRTTADLMADFENELPSLFRNLETRQLLAGIVDQIMYLAERHPLKDQQDPASYLDQVEPSWANAFPIPLDENNARLLLNEWLRDAGQKRQERKEALERARAFTCEHFLYGTLPQWSVYTELILPAETTFQLDVNNLNSTRLELAYYEGERLLARGPAVYGQVTEQGIKVRFSNTQVTLARQKIDEPVSLRLLDNGYMVYCLFLDDSALDYCEAPLIFEHRSERWQLAASSSCSLSSGLVRLRVPPGFTLSCDNENKSVLGEDQEQGLWVESRESLSLVRGEEHYSISLKQERDSSNRPFLTGVFALYDTLPSLVYMGWPRLELPDDYPYAKEELLELINGKQLDRHHPHAWGAVRYTLRTRSGKLLLQRRFGVLPQDLNLSLFPESPGHPARLLTKGAVELDLCIINNELKTTKTENILYLKYNGDTPPSSFILEAGQNLPAVQLRLPYPYQGARLLDQNSIPSSAHELTLNELLGHRIVLTSGLPQGQTFHLQLQLVSTEQPHPKRAFSIQVGSKPVMLSLFSYLNDIQNMLGAVDDQDVYIRLSLETEQPLLKLDIRRYNGHMQWEGRDNFFIRNASNKIVLDGAQAEAMLLSDPKRAPLQLAEKMTESTGTGNFEIPSVMQSCGPWLIYPAESSAIHFRPALYLAPERHEDTAVSVTSLHRAAKLFHPVHNPHVINEQVAVMAGDFNHSGWQYLADLKQNYRHLPLSSFETWKALSRNPEALSFAVFRLEIDEAFCSRIRDELAVIWETIPLPLWVKANQLFHKSMLQTGLPEVLVNNLISNRASVLRSIVSGFDYLGDYLSTGNRYSLTTISPEQILPLWYQDLRRLHVDNRNWPTQLSNELTNWIQKQTLPPRVKALSLVDFTDTVTYLPVFMAFVTAGRASITDLQAASAYLKFAIRVVADFDRQGWFMPVHALMVSYLLASPNKA